MVGEVIEGIVVAGLGEGAYFMSMEHYKKEIKKKLGFDAFPGTLNIKTAQIDLFKKLTPIIISGFKKDDKTFGGVSCYKAKINGINGSVIITFFNSIIFSRK